MILGKLNSSIILSEEYKITGDKKVITATNKGSSDEFRAERSEANPALRVQRHAGGGSRGHGRIG